jgi:hypothetical protein
MCLELDLWKVVLIKTASIEQDLVVQSTNMRSSLAIVRHCGRV